MTLLAVESTSGANSLLKSYGVEPAKSYKDLEYKLADLYFNKGQDKATLEKQLFALHPHKDWIVRISESEKPQVPVINPNKSNADGEQECSACKCQKCQSSSFSNFDYQNATAQEKAQNSIDNAAFVQQHPYISAVPIIGLVGIFSVLIYALAKTNKG